MVKEERDLTDLAFSVVLNRWPQIKKDFKNKFGDAFNLQSAARDWREIRKLGYDELKRIVEEAGWAAQAEEAELTAAAAAANSNATDRSNDANLTSMVLQ